jgi:GNAT superfamily N-acetyltransferase
VTEAAATDLEIRDIRLSDADAVAELSAELGYPATPEIMKMRIAQLQHLVSKAVYIACLGPRVVGWIDIGLTQHLQTELYAEIGGLVVSSTVRSKGIGKALVAWAERWARERCVQLIVVRSRLSRERAHRFYEREGYTRYKTSAVFQKVL